VTRQRGGIHDTRRRHRGELPRAGQRRAGGAIQQNQHRSVDAPPIITAEQLAPGISITTGALAQDRYRNQGIPYIKMGRRIRYVRADVARYLMANRRATVEA
jgi:hypothetical protein